MHVNGLGGEAGVGGGGERSGEVVVLGVHDDVPNGVKLVGTVMVGEIEGVGTAVTLGKVSVVLVQVVERLVDISNEVNEETEGIGLGNFGHAGVKSVVDVVVDVGVEVFVAVSAVGEPLDEHGDADGQVTGLVGRVEVLDGATLVKVGSLLEVVVGLPSATVVLDVVSKGSNFCEGVGIFVVGEGGVVVAEVLQLRESLGKGAGGLFVQDVGGDLGSCK